MNIQVDVLTQKLGELASVLQIWQAGISQQLEVLSDM